MLVCQLRFGRWAQELGREGLRGGVRGTTKTGVREEVCPDPLRTWSHLADG